MGILTREMGQYDAAREVTVSSGYDDEVMSSGWNPIIGLNQLAPEPRKNTFPTELSNVDLDVFLKKMYE